VVDSAPTARIDPLDAYARDGVSALVAVQPKGPAQADAEARLLLYLIRHNYATHKHPDLTKLICDAWQLGR
jgi:hypothetical protein